MNEITMKTRCLSRILHIAIVKSTMMVTRGTNTWMNQRARYEMLPVTHSGLAKSAEVVGWVCRRVDVGREIQYI